MTRELEKYCVACGARCDLVPAGHYDTRTGEPIMRAVCPTSLCEHTGVRHTMRQGFLDLFWPSRCTKCGQYGVNWED